MDENVVLGLKICLFHLANISDISGLETGFS